MGKKGSLSTAISYYYILFFQGLELKIKEVLRFSKYLSDVAKFVQYQIYLLT